MVYSLRSTDAFFLVMPYRMVEGVFCLGMDLWSSIHAPRDRLDAT